MVEISLSGSGEGLGRAIARGYSTGRHHFATPLICSYMDLPDCQEARLSSDHD